jgi:virginiamycin B lyase
MFKSTAKGNLTTFPIAGAHVGSVVVGPDKNIWFSDYGNAKLGRITKTGAITEFALNPGAYPGSLAVGPDKNFWITEARSFVKMSVSGAIIKVYNGNKKLTKNEVLDSIVAAPDGNLYFTESANDNKTPDKIGRITTHGKISEIGTLPVSAYPDGMAVGKDGNVYFAMHEMQAVGEINLASGKVSYHWVAMTHGDTGAESIAEGPDKRLWLGGCSTIYAVSY